MPDEQNTEGKNTLKVKPEDCFYGTVTVGERGQIVIPADARRQIGIQAGDRLILLRHPSEQGLVLFKSESMRAFMTKLLETIERAETAPDAVGTRPADENV